MHRKTSAVMGMLVFLYAAVACTVGSRSPTAMFQLPPPPPGGPTSEPTIEIPTATGTILLPPTVPPIAYVYAVVLVPEGGTLDVHTAAGKSSPASGTLAWDAVDLQSTGNFAAVGTDTWVELNLAGGGTGWVNRNNLTEYVPSGTFCTDPGPLALFPTIGMAVNISNGSALAALVSPVHGLAVGYIHGGTPRVYAPPELASIFTSTESVNWGLGPGSGLPVMGTFNDLVRPDLVNVFSASYEAHCNTITLGGASYIVTWPPQWKNINFYSVYKPGSPGIELDWMTWLVGVDYVDGLPYLFSLSRYNWEP